jgi:hypothetical protein
VVVVVVPVAVVVLVVEVEVALGVVVVVVVVAELPALSPLLSTAQVMLLVTSSRFLAGAGAGAGVGVGVGVGAGAGAEQRFWSHQKECLIHFLNYPLKNRYLA